MEGDPRLTRAQKQPLYTRDEQPSRERCNVTMQKYGIVFLVLKA